jgi:predicted sulfurtransferase
VVLIFFMHGDKSLVWFCLRSKISHFRLNNCSPSRCERASALLKQKIDEDDDTKDLGIKGVYQLQGGIDKYFRHFPAGGLWKGKNYTFDKRFAHAPPAVEAVKRTKRALGDEGPPDASSIAADEKKSDDGTPPANATDEILGKCEACSKPWVSCLP